MTSRVFLHIGPPKTGTTTIQSALNARRTQLLAQGIRYVGAGSQTSAAAMAVTRRRNPANGRYIPISTWNDVLRELRRSVEHTAIISSEWFAGADRSQIERLAADLRPYTVSVLITIRSLELILPSRWQQNVIEGASYGYEEWLEEIFAPTDSPRKARFWHQQDHGKLALRWAAAFGTDQIHIVCVNETEPLRLLRDVEAITGITPGTLDADEVTKNRKMDRQEVEEIRRFNELVNSRGVSRSLAYLSVSRGAVVRLQAVESAVRSRITPIRRDVHQRVVAASEAIIVDLQNSGVRVFGDLRCLRATEQIDCAEVNPSDVAVPRKSTVIPEMLFGQLVALGLEPNMRSDSAGMITGLPDGFVERGTSEEVRQADRLIRAISQSRFRPRRLLKIGLQIVFLGARASFAAILKRSPRKRL